MPRAAEPQKSCRMRPSRSIQEEVDVDLAAGRDAVLIEVRHTRGGQYFVIDQELTRALGR